MRKPTFKELSKPAVDRLRSLIENPDYAIQSPWPTRSFKIDLEIGQLVPDNIKIVYVPYIIAIEEKTKVRDIRLPQFLRYLWYTDLVIYECKNAGVFEETVKLLNDTITSLSPYDRRRLIVVSPDWKKAYSWLGKPWLFINPGGMNYEWLKQKVIMGSQITSLNISKCNVVQSIDFRNILGRNMPRTKF